MRKTIAGAVAGLVALGSAGMAIAAPPDAETFELECDNGETYEIWTNGRGDFTPGHIVGSPGVLIPYYFHDVGTFTPPGGDPEPFNERMEKGNGNAMKHRELTVCTLEFSFSDPSGASGEGTSEVGAVVRGP